MNSSRTTYLAPVLLSSVWTTVALAAHVPIQNNAVWKDDRGEEIMCQGGSLCRFGDTYYFYGWADYPGDNRTDTITCYSSKDLASWEFENHIFKRDATNLTLIVPDRLHVLYNDSTRQYVMIGKHILPVDDAAIPGQPRVTGGVSFFTGATPTGAFTYLGHEMLPAGTGTEYHRDLAAFKDRDGTAYVASSHDQHKSNRNIMITRLTADYLHVARSICEIPLNNGAFEAPYIIRLKERYWLFVSGGGRPSAWDGSPTYYSTAAAIAGPWSAFKTVKTDPYIKDSFNAQSDFLFEVNGSNGSFVLWGGDRWSQRTRVGVGKNVWLPLQWSGGEPILRWCPTWQVDAAAGTWTASPTGGEAQPTTALSPACGAISTIMPRIEGNWWTIARNPDLGDLTSPKQQPVDFSIWHAADGTWQLWSCIRNTNLGGRTRLFHGWEGKQLTECDWKPMGIALRPDANVGEESVQSPYVFKEGDTYHLFYGEWNSICRATSRDGKTFTRVIGPNGKTGMFGEGRGNFARDPMVLRTGDTYRCYYCANPEGKGKGRGIAYCRTSKDLNGWSESKPVAFGGTAGTGWTSAECPFVYYHAASGYYYLFRTQAYGDPGKTTVYASKDPMDFGINDDRCRLGTLPVAAPEIIEHEGQTYLASLLPNLKGIRVARLKW